MSDAHKAMVKLLRFLARGEAREQACEGSALSLHLGDGALHIVSQSLLAAAVSAGLVSRTGGWICLAPAARSYLRRAASLREEAFIEQHGAIDHAVAEVGDGRRQPVRINREESPLSGLARLKEKTGGPFLSAAALAAGERLLADFTRGQLQPRVTASWEPHHASRAKGERGGMADLTDSAIAARVAVNRALEAMGPELAGVALDVCCFMKGLETVERERQWPARSAKLMLRTALMVLSRHYNPPMPARRARVEHWGAEGYRPELYS
ncbi:MULTISPECIES: DUF6456 domain-containing protein [unclassified Rhizobium]|uniref:DUF6456 domain-containing protein n=1 Tax=unclassified Rhizobium TaxID=2613769 RepID=UPI00161C2873|nr:MULTISPECIES: DUF6456 domain-containing protein [unclassified Rhizobium]MBB3539784.1 hypothetical protein [Rhizobium sp. BK399]MCS3739207.1 hypothetical protein [Rhizobium sp. BK661]